MENLSVATWSFAAGADPEANAQVMSDGLRAAATAGAQVVVMPECCLTGYPSAGRVHLGDLDWVLVARLEQELAALSASLGVVLVAGTCARSADGCTNQALACVAGTLLRYDKRCLTPIDQGHFRAGSSALLIAAGGWRLGLGICYDLRFPDVWMELAARGADAFLVVAHMAGPDPDPGTKQALIPALCATRAAETATPLVLANTAGADRYLDSGIWDARGARLGSQVTGLLLANLRHRSRWDPWYAQLHDTALRRWRDAGR